MAGITKAEREKREKDRNRAMGIGVPRHQAATNRMLTGHLTRVEIKDMGNGFRVTGKGNTISVDTANQANRVAAVLRKSKTGQDTDTQTAIAKIQFLPPASDKIVVDFKSGPLAIPIIISKKEAIEGLKEAIHDSKEAGDHRTQSLAEKQLKELEGDDNPSRHNQSFRNRSMTQRQLDRGR